MKSKVQSEAKRILVMVLAAAIMAINTRSFTNTAGLYPGGAMGLTLLIQGVFDKFFGIAIPYTFVNLLLNAFPVYIGFRFIGRKFTWRSLVVILLIGVLTDFIPPIVITYDTLLIAIFGGVINGFGISLALSVECTTGGTDFISIYLSQKKGMDTWNIILGINAVILVLAGILFGWDKALYSIIYQYASTEVLHILYKRYQKQTLLIITEKPREIVEGIYSVAHHGATILKGEGGYTHENRYIIYSVVSRDEVKKIMNVVTEAGGQTFVNTFKSDDVLGNFYHSPHS
ncbi:MAG: YitT family protein [Lachnospiraceae bacterium]|nr:YitT family protein [Lachnospiraceae bacterium]